MSSAFAKRIRTASAKYQKSKRPSKIKTLSVPRNLGMLYSLGKKGFPDYIDVDMNYCEWFLLDPAAGIAANYVFRCNSIQDPNATGVGHQPMGHDEMSSIYSKYKVLKSTIRATCFTRGTGDVNTCLFAVRPVTSSGVITDIVRVGEFKDTKYAPIYGDPGTVTIFHNWNQNRVSKAEQDGLQADFGSNPSTEWYYHVTLGNIDNTQDPSAHRVFVKITYTVRCFELKDLAQS